jgi:hypothetical protein
VAHTFRLSIPAHCQVLAYYLSVSSINVSQTIRLIARRDTNGEILDWSHGRMPESPAFVNYSEVGVSGGEKPCWYIEKNAPIGIATKYSGLSHLAQYDPNLERCYETQRG